MYEGEFKDYERNGFGIFTYEKNSYYEGNFEKSNLKDKENLLLMKIMNMKEFGKANFRLEMKKILK